MSDEAALLLAIDADPADDLPRLAYADWLEEQGGEGARSRGAFIRTQIRMEGLRRGCRCGRCVARRGGGQHTNGPCVLDQRDNRDLLVAQKCLLEDGGFEEWTRPVKGLFGATIVYDLDVKYRKLPHPAVGVRFVRGFVMEVHCAVKGWIDCGRQVVLYHPVTAVRATDRAPAHAGSDSALPYRWHVVHGDDLHSPHYLPGELIGVAGAAAENCYRYRCFATPEAAHAALSAAMLDWARPRERAPAPDLTPAPTL